MGHGDGSRVPHIAHRLSFLVRPHTENLDDTVVRHIVLIREVLCVGQHHINKAVLAVFPTGVVALQIAC